MSLSNDAISKNAARLADVSTGKSGTDEKIVFTIAREICDANSDGECDPDTKAKFERAVKKEWKKRGFVLSGDEPVLSIFRDELSTSAFVHAKAVYSHGDVSLFDPQGWDLVSSFFDLSTSNSKIILGAEIIIAGPLSLNPAVFTLMTGIASRLGDDEEIIPAPRQEDKVDLSGDVISEHETPDAGMVEPSPLKKRGEQPTYNQTDIDKKLPEISRRMQEGQKLTAADIALLENIALHGHDKDTRTEAQMALGFFPLNKANEVNLRLEARSFIYDNVEKFVGDLGASHEWEGQQEKFRKKLKGQNDPLPKESAIDEMSMYCEATGGEEALLGFISNGDAMNVVTARTVYDPFSLESDVSTITEIDASGNVQEVSRSTYASPQCQEFFVRVIAKALAQDLCPEESALQDATCNGKLKATLEYARDHSNIPEVRQIAGDALSK